ncbi:phosphonate C-P lyase system protein PhnH [Actinopolymorpha pittospori]
MTGTRTLGERARAIRLNPFAAQCVFDQLLDSLARPGTLAQLEFPPGVPPASLPAVALADVEVRVAVLEDGAGWADPVYAVTGAPPAPAAEADMVVALRPVTAEEVTTLRRGTAYAPEDGARLVIAVERLDSETGPLRLALSGPGVPGERTVAVTGLDHTVVTALARVNSDFPAGVDVHLVAADGVLVSVPRSVRIRIAGPADSAQETAREMAHETAQERTVL